MLVDGGPRGVGVGDDVVAYLRERGSSSLNMLSPPPDADHIGGLISVLRSLNVCVPGTQSI